MRKAVAHTLKMLCNLPKELSVEEVKKELGMNLADASKKSL